MTLRPRSAMFGFSVRAAEKMTKAGRLALLFEPGYCKTIATLTALLDMGAWPALVVAPPRVAKQVWPEEVASWEHLKNLTITPIAGKGGKLRMRDPQDPKKMVLAEDVKKLGLDSHIETISYENLFWLTEHVDIESRYKAIIFDELSKMKTPGSVRFKRMRGRGMDIPVRFGLTGSPVGNHHLDLWGEMFMVAAEKPLGSTFSGYRDRYFQAMNYMQNVWELKHSPSCRRYDDQTKECNCALARECEREIHKRIAPYAHVLPAQPEVTVPKWVPNIVKVPMPDNVQRMGRELESQLWTMLESGTELEALSRSSVAMKLRQLASGAVYTSPVFESAETHTTTWERVHTAKEDAVDDILDELQGEPALVVYWFQHEHDRLKACFERAGRTWASGASTANVARWNNRELDVLLLHPQSAGHGLNLQHGGHHVIITTAPWSWELLDQINRRLARVGQKAPFVNSHILSCGPADQRILPLVSEKGAAERRLFADLLAG